MPSGCDEAQYINHVVILSVFIQKSLLKSLTALMWHPATHRSKCYT